jgi:hypothetical protein
MLDMVGRLLILLSIWEIFSVKSMLSLRLIIVEICGSLVYMFRRILCVSDRIEFKLSLVLVSAGILERLLRGSVIGTDLRHFQCIIPAVSINE